MSGTLESYDALPYEAVPIPETHPDHLAALAGLAGHAAPDPAAARILELGCAEGGNLIPIAFYWPGTRCTGLELSRSQAAAGQELAQAAGLDNCRILHADLAAPPEGFGEFDYIVAHGVYSWVPEAVRESLIALCARHLAPQGIAYVSFNVMPGWSSRLALRESLLRATAGAAGPRARAAAAQQALADLARRFGETPLAAHPDLEAEIGFLLRASPSYLFHEYLDETNEPETFAAFRERAGRHGLRCLCDAGPGTCARAWGRDHDDGMDEDGFDARTGNRFRRALLVRASAPPTGPVEPACCADVRSDEELDLAAVVPQYFVNRRGTRATVALPRTKAALMALAMVYPDSLSRPELDQAADQILGHFGVEPTPADDAFEREWRRMLACQFAWPVATARHFDRTETATPRLHRLACLQAARGLPLAGVRHLALDPDPEALALARFLDGTRNAAALVAAMRPVLLESGAAAEEAAVATAIEDMLALFARHGLLAAAGG